MLFKLKSKSIKPKERRKQNEKNKKTNCGAFINSNAAWGIKGSFPAIRASGWNFSFGIRPVITVLKSNLYE